MTKHGMTNSSEYKIWIHMKQRCFNQNNPSYPDYGGRGITVSPLWIDDFIQFYNDVGARPGLDYSLDRINNDGNYEPDNVRWATVSEQAKNKRFTRSKSGYIGVYEQDGRWRASLNVSLGVFDTPEKAAIEYNIAISKIRGDEAVLNTIK